MFMVIRVKVQMVHPFSCHGRAHIHVCRHPDSVHTPPTPAHDPSLDLGVNSGVHTWKSRSSKEAHEAVGAGSGRREVAFGWAPWIRQPVEWARVQPSNVGSELGALVTQV